MGYAKGGKHVLDLYGRVWEQGGCRDGLCEKMLKLASCQVEPVPASFKMELPLATSQSTSNVGAPLLDLRRCEKLYTAAVRGVREL